MEQLEVEIEKVSKKYDEGEGLAVRDVSMSIEKGELLVVVGPSGCGKSTTLRMVAGLEEPLSGEIRIGGKSMNKVAPQDRDVAMVFQGYALYPQMTVRENLEFPLKMRKVDPAERKKRSDEAAEMLRLGRFMNRLPSELSGGERQRVAMGRAIVRRPRVFLFDEPLSNLDAALRAELRVEIGVLVRELGVTAMYVTHDQVEAMTLADRICVMEKGRVQQIGTPREIYEAPATEFVGTFLGAPRMNVLPVLGGPFALSTVPAAAKRFGIRPEDLRVGDDGVPFEVALAEPLGAETHLVLKKGDASLRVRVPGFDPRPHGSTVHVAIDTGKVHWFDADGARV